jgi:hypothetical protein
MGAGPKRPADDQLRDEAVRYAGQISQVNLIRLAL